MENTTKRNTVAQKKEKDIEASREDSKQKFQKYKQGKTFGTLAFFYVKCSESFTSSLLMLNLCKVLAGHEMAIDTCSTTSSSCKIKEPSLQKNYKKVKDIFQTWTLSENHLRISVKKNKNSKSRAQKNPEEQTGPKIVK